MNAIFKRELAAYFKSPVGYAYIAICFLAAGLGFMKNLQKGSTDLTEIFMILSVLQFIFIPFITMRLFSEEKKQKTDQLLLTSPVTLTGVVLGKFLSSMVVFIVATSVTVIYAAGLDSVKGVEIYWTSVMGNYIGLFFIGSLFIAIGLFVSAFTESQMVAALISFMINFVLFLGDWFAPFLKFKWLIDFVNALSVSVRFSEISFGILKPETILYFASITFAFLFLTVRVLDSRRYS